MLEEAVEYGGVDYNDNCLSGGRNKEKTVKNRARARMQNY